MASSSASLNRTPQSVILNQHMTKTTEKMREKICDRFHSVHDKMHKISVIVAGYHNVQNISKD